MRDTEKAPDAFRTISEVADDLQLPQHVLRFWETRFTQIKPVKRAGGRRFYRPEDVDLLRGIRHLLYTDGFTIKGAQRILKDQGVRYVQDLGIEREVAVMRTARPPRDLEADGTTFGGLLGLLPRRKGKGREDDGLPDLPPVAELPLPFPDQEADRDLDSDASVPPLALRRGPPERARRAPPPGQGERAPQPREREAREPPSRGPRMEPLPLPLRDHPPQRDPREPPPSRDLPPSREAARREPLLERPPEPPPPRPRRPEEPRPERHPHEDIPRASGGRRDPTFDAAPEQGLRPPSFADDDALPQRHPLPQGQESRRQEPRGEERDGRRGDPRVEPALSLQRPSRGPASRIAQPRPPHPAELDDPLLPFLDDPLGGAQGVSEPIEARIRRLKALEQEREPAPRDAHPGAAGWEEARWTREPEREAPPRRAPPREAARDPGPPEEYIPARARKPAPPPTPARALREDGQGRILQDGDWRQTDWVEEVWSEDSWGEEVWREETWREEIRHDEVQAKDVRQALPERAPSPPSAPPPFDAGPVGDDDFPETASMDQDRRRPPAGPQPHDRREPPMPAPAQDLRHEDLRREDPRRDRMPPAARDGRADATRDNWRDSWADAWGDAPPQALPRATRVGPLIGPIDEEELPHPTDWRGASAPLPSSARTEGGRGEAEAPRRAPPWNRPEPPAAPPPPPPQSARIDARAPDYPVESGPAGEPFARPPREPLRQGPPEQYLPPHLRSEPRVMGHAPVAAPVLSREDVHRLQSVLYELGECRRLMEGLVGAREEVRDAD
uniref:MerR family transcriptional regulator n=1 Tax=Xanthobacter nonsaccharivorans TaxID=3119912 RepID=UPI00372D27A5